MSIQILFYIIAAVLFAISSFNVPVTKVNLQSLGLFFLTLALLVPSIR